MSGQNRRITEIDVVDVQKRRNPSKHYVYIVQVTWSDLRTNVIYRRYSRFFDFQHELLEKFPLEAGVIDPTQRIIPFLPGKIYLGRSHIREVALKRLTPIHEYCQALIKCPDKISQCSEVLEFFDLEPDDLNPSTEEDEKKKKAKNKTVEKISAPKLAEEYVVVADYEKEDKWDITLQAGMIVDVLEKSESGWWFVHVEEQQGWVPSTYLERRDGSKDTLVQRARPGEEEKYICTDAYDANGADEVTLETGAVVEVIQKSLDGWWLIRYKGQEGYAPSTYLMKTEKAHMERVARASGVQVVSTLSDISDLLKEDHHDSDGGEKPIPKKTLPHVLKKSKSLERGGSIRPPPRQNTIKNRNNNIMVKNTPPSSSNYVYCTIADFSDSVGDGISFRSNQKVTVLDKADTGWWFIQIGDKEGWAPSSYIEKQDVITIQESVIVEGDEGIDQGSLDEEPTQDEHYDEVGNVDSDSDSDEWDYENSEQPLKSEVNEPKLLLGQPALSPRSVPLKSDVSKPEVIPKRPKPPTSSESNRPVSSGRPGARPPPPPIKSNVIGQDKSHDEATRPPMPGMGGIADALKSRFDSNQSNKTSNQNRRSQTNFDGVPKPSLPPKLPSKSSGPKSPREIENKSDVGIKGGNLADVLKSKFEARQSLSENTDQVPPKPDKFPKTTGTKPLLPPGKQTTGNLPSSNISSSAVQGRPLTPTKKNKPPVMPPKSPVSKSAEFLDKQDSDLASVLKAKFEKRQSASQENLSETKPPGIPPKKQPFTKPTIPKTSEGFTKPTSPKTSEGSGKQVSSGPSWSSKESTASDSKPETGIASALKSKFESAGIGQNTKPTDVSTKPVIPAKAQSSKPNLPSKSLNKPDGISKTEPPPPKVKPWLGSKPQPPSVEKVGKTENVSNTQPSKIGAGNFAALKAKLEQTNPPVNNFSNQSKPTKASIETPIASKASKGKTKIYRTIADYDSNNEGEISFYEGDVVEVIEKSPGWWLVRVGNNEGWAPATYIEEDDTSDENVNLSNNGFSSTGHDSGFTSPSNDKELVIRYKTCGDFVAQSDGEVGFSRGVYVDVLEKGGDGWWLVSVNGLEGWAPASYIKEIKI